MDFLSKCVTFYVNNRFTREFSQFHANSRIVRDSIGPQLVESRAMRELESEISRDFRKRLALGEILHAHSPRNDPLNF